MDSPLLQIFVYLAAAVITVPIAKRLGLGSVLGYLIAGALIGPFALRLVNTGEGVVHVAEFGVVMMLFLVGLELQPRLLWQMRGMLFGLGGLQVALTAIVVAGAATLLGLSWQVGLAIGLTFAMSSTAIVLQSLNERGALKTPGGQASFAVLLFQDLAVIPILAIFPLLAGGGPEAAATGATAAEQGHASGAETWIASLPGWGRTLVVLGAVAVVVGAGRYLVRPLFRFIASTGLREIFTAAALMLVVGIAALMTYVGLSPALGTFLAGVVLADSEYRHELEGDIEPFKGLLLGLFFLSVGAGIDFGLVVQRPGTIAGVVAALITIKLLVVYGLGLVFRLGRSQAWLLGFALAQGGEFAFVLCSFGQQTNVFGAETAAILVASVALSMAVAPLLFLFDARVMQPAYARCKEQLEPKRPQDSIPAQETRVVIAGIGRFGHIPVRLLRANGFVPTVLDLDPEQVDTLRRLGVTCFYGDASRLDLLHAAGMERAHVFVLAIDNPEHAVQIARTVRQHFPHVEIIARAHDRFHAYELMQAGVQQIFRETLDSSLELSIAALRSLGVRAHKARRAAQTFRDYDETALREMAALADKEEEYMAAARKRIADFEELVKQDERRAIGAAWDTESLKRGF